MRIRTARLERDRLVILIAPDGAKGVCGIAPTGRRSSAPAGTVTPFDIADHGFRFARLAPGCAPPVATTRRPAGARIGPIISGPEAFGQN